MTSTRPDRTNDHERPVLPMVTPPDPKRLEAEREYLSSLQAKGPIGRSLGYLRCIGPGYLQSAMTLGGGTAAASLFAGAAFGYELLWVAPLAMALGVVMLAAVAHQTLSTGMRPFVAMKTYAGPFFAYGWAIGALVASIIWHFPQYSLASSVLVDMGDVAGIKLNRAAMGFMVLAFAIPAATMYGTSTTMVRAFERILKYVVWLIVVCFGIVVVKTGIDDPGSLLRGFIAFRIPSDVNDVKALTVILSGLAAAVGINMIFLYPYSLLSRGWGREHRGLARFDLFAGMFLPYVIATSLMVIATANTIHAGGDFADKSLSPIAAAQSLATTIGPNFGRIVFNLGVLAMAWSSITLHMLCTGFACSEMFNWPVGSTKYRLATLLPIPGVLGAVYWSDIAIWIALPTSIACGFLLPIAYIGFIKLQNSRKYLAADRPEGARRIAWLAAMSLTTLILTVFLVKYTLVDKVPGYIRKFTPDRSQQAP